MANEYTRPSSPPPPLFLGEKERDLVKQVNDELIERVVGQQVVYYSIDMERSNFHSVYGEAITKTFLPPVRIYALVDWEGSETEGLSYGIDKKSSIMVHFHKRRLTEDQDIYVRPGDFVFYGDIYYEIVETGEPRAIFGQIGHKIEVSAKCVKAREGLFDAE